MRRSLLPVAAATAGWLAAAVGWVGVVQPHLPAPIDETQHTRGRFVDVAGADTVLFTFGEPRPDGLLFVGDSRVQAGIDLAAARAVGVPSPALLVGPGGQLKDLLAALEGMPPGRAVIALSALSLYNPRKDGPLVELAAWRGPWTPERIDAELDARLGILRGRFVHPTIRPGRWQDGWIPVPDPTRDVRTYKVVMGEPTREPRVERLALLRADLEGLLARGGRIACMRTPISDELFAIERRGLAPNAFGRLCEELSLPFLDYYHAPFVTGDGGHLTPGEAAKFTRRLAQDLARRTDILAD